MGFIDKYPYTDFHELNLDWILERVKALTADMEHFKAINEVTYRGQWNITEQYTAWSVVTNGTTGYLATQPVPSGIAITNTDYWVVIDDFSDVQAIQAELDQLEAAVSPLLNRKFLLVGDSFGEAANGWIANMVTAFGWNSGDYFSYAEGGIGYCQAGNNSGKVLEDALEDYLDTLTSDQKASITDVIVIAGENDIKPQYRNGPMATAVSSFYSWLFSGILPNVQKVLVGFNGTFLQPANATYGPRSEYRWEFRRDIRNQVLDFPKVVFGEDIEFSLNSTVLVEADGIHPTASGYKYITRAIMNALNGGGFENIFESDAHSVKFISGSKFNSIKIPVNTTLYTGAITLTGGGMTTIGTWSDLPWYPKYGISIYIPLPDIIVDGDTSTHYTNLVLRFVYNGTIQIYNPNPSISVSSSIMATGECGAMYDSRQ